MRSSGSEMTSTAPAVSSSIWRSTSTAVDGSRRHLRPTGRQFGSCGAFSRAHARLLVGAAHDAHLVGGELEHRELTVPTPERTGRAPGRCPPPRRRAPTTRRRESGRWRARRSRHRTRGRARAASSSATLLALVTLDAAGVVRREHEDRRGRGERPGARAAQANACARRSRSRSPPRRTGPSGRRCLPRARRCLSELDRQAAVDRDRPRRSRTTTPGSARLSTICATSSGSP